jgi:hypothetical protein
VLHLSFNWILFGSFELSKMLFTLEISSYDGPNFLGVLKMASLYLFMHLQSKWGKFCSVVFFARE